MIEQVLEYVRRRSVSTLVVSYTVFWAIYHWQGIYATIFTSQDYIMEKYGMLKNEYVAHYFFGINQEYVGNWILGLVIPAVLAILYVTVLPFLINLVYRVEIKHKVDRKIIKIREERRLSVEERKNMEVESKNADAQIELGKKRAEAELANPETVWEKEYRDFLGEDASSAFAVLDELKTMIYSHSGYTRNGYGTSYISEDSLMECDTNGLIEFNSKANNNVTLTKKGKYFLRQFSKKKH